MDRLERSQIRRMSCPPLSYTRRTPCLYRCARVYGLGLYLVCLYAVGADVARARDDVPPAFFAPQVGSLEELEDVIAERSPERLAKQREAALAEAEVKQARLYNNPELEASWGTLPLGTTNPTDLTRPWANVPNYGVGLSYTFPVGKRGPRQREAAARARAAHAEVDLTTRQLALSLAQVLGELATSTMRREGLLSLEESAERSVSLAQARLATQFGTGLDVDRARIDLQRVRQQRLGVENDIRAGLSECSRIVMRSCQGFEDGVQARAFLRTWLRLSQGKAQSLKKRPDLRVLEAEAQAARAAAQLAEAEKIPDPTVRLGYVHDRFLESGNHRNSLNLSVSVPLPVFDHGQVKQRAAKRERKQLLQERDARLQRAQQQIALLSERSELAQARCDQLTHETMPEAHAVLQSLERAEASQLVSSFEVIQARRTVSELVLEEADACADAYEAVLSLLEEAPRKHSP